MHIGIILTCYIIRKIILPISSMHLSHVSPILTMWRCRISEAGSQQHSGLPTTITSWLRGFCLADSLHLTTSSFAYQLWTRMLQTLSCNKSEKQKEFSALLRCRACVGKRMNNLSPDCRFKGKCHYLILSDQNLTCDRLSGSRWILLRGLLVHQPSTARAEFSGCIWPCSIW